MALSDVEKCLIKFEQIIQIIILCIRFFLKTYLRDKTKIDFHGKNKSISRDFYLPLHKQIHINAVQLIEFISISPDKDLSVEALDNIKVCRDL